MKRYFCMSLAALFLVALVPTESLSEQEYGGAKSCKKCHLKQYKSWEKTSMGTALETLKAGEKAEEKKAAGLDPEKDYTTDEECLGCHTTGLGKPGGYTVGGENEYLDSVGCESCHGPGGDYLDDTIHSTKNKEFKSADQIALGFIPKPDGELCEACHNDKSPTAKEFDYEALKEKPIEEQGTHEHYDLKYEH